MRFQGAEARVYFGTYDGKSAVKKERFCKKYRHPDLDQQLRKQRTRAEVRALTRIRDKCPRLKQLIPAILFSDTYTIIMEEVTDSRMCVEAMKEEAAAGRDTDWIFQSIGQLIADIHAAGTIHGDLTTSNLLIKGKDIIPIDFGLSSSSTSAEDRAVDLYVLERALLSSQVDGDKFSILLSAYKYAMNKLVTNYREVESVLTKLEEVRGRGRKRCMAG